MRDALLIVAAATVSLAGFGAMALGQERHWHAVTGLGEEMRLPGRLLLAAGLTAQVLSCAMFVLAQGAGFGALLWGLVMTAKAMSIAFALTWRPAALRPMARVLRASKRGIA